MITIEMVLYIIIGVIMVLSVIWGIIQGFKKNLYNLIATILFWLIFFLTANLAMRVLCSNLILNSTSLYQTLNSTMNLEGMLKEEHEVTTLMEFSKYYVGEMMGLDAELLSDPAIENTLIALIIAILKIVYLIFLAIFYAIIRIIIYHTVFKRFFSASPSRLKKLEKNQEKYVENHDKENSKLAREIRREKKKVKFRGINRLLGILTGAARGALASFLILALINSTVKLLPSLQNNNETASTEEDNEEKLNLYDFILSYVGDNEIAKTAIDMIKDYQSSSLINSTGIKINGKPADDIFIDSILSGESKDYSVALRKEFSLVVQIAEYAFDLTNGFKMETVNYTALNNRQVNDLKQILTILADSDLLQNLGSVMVGIAVSIDAVKDQLGPGFELVSEEVKNIDWKKELTTIASLVSDVYGLGDDLTKLNYYSLDEEKVSSIIETLGNLQIINVLAHVGLSYGLTAVTKDKEGYEEQINNINRSLATLAMEGKYGKDVASFKDLYSEFLNLYRQADIDFNNFENSSIYKLTYIDSLELSPIFNTILEANFVSALLPDTLEILKNEVLPAEYGSIINPNVSTSAQWEGEINAILQIVHDVTHDSDGAIHPFEDIKEYDFELLNNFSSETVVNSELLSYAMIRMMIDTSKHQGIMAKIDGTEQLQDYVKVPDTLAQDEDANHKFNAKWYGTATETGELKIMLDTVKNVASQLRNLEYPVDQIPAMLAAVNKSDLMASDVLYYSLDNVISQNLQEYITIPLSETGISKDTVNGLHIDHMINRESLKEVINVISDSNIVDLEQIYSYHVLDENGNIAYEIPSREDAEPGDEVVVTFDTATEKILNLLTSKKLYNPANPTDDANLNKLFNSKILRATVTTLLNDYTDDKIYVPANSLEPGEQCITATKEEGQETATKQIKNVDIIKKNQFKALIMAVDDLQLPLSKLVTSNGDSIDINVFVDALKQEGTTDLKEQVKDIFGFGSQGYDSIKYSGILHGTLSKYLLDEANKTSGDITIVIPTESKDTTDTNLIIPEETVNLIQSIVIVGVDSILDSEGAGDDMMDSIITNVRANTKALNSAIIRATLTDYVERQETGIVIPNMAADTAISSVKAVSKQDFEDLLDVLGAMKEVKEEESGTSVKYSDLLDTANLTISMITNADKKEGKPISKSVIIRATLVDQLEKNDIKVPQAAFIDRDLSKTITIDETSNLVDALATILDVTQTVNNISTDGITIDKITSDDARKAIKKSIVIKNLVTEKMSEVEDDDHNKIVIIPENSLDSDGILIDNEIDQMLQGFAKLVEDKTKAIENLEFDTIKIGAIEDATPHIKESLVLRATITKVMKDQDDVVVSASALDDAQTTDMLTKDEVDHLVVALLSIFDKEDNASNLNIDSLTIGKVNGARTSLEESIILRTTVSKKIIDNADLEVPVESIDTDIAEVVKDATAYKTISKTELDNLLVILDALGSEKTINNVSADDVTVKSLVNKKPEISASYIMRATLYKNVYDNADVYIPEQAKQDTTSVKPGNATISVITVTETGSLIDVLSKLFNENDKVNNLDVNGLTIGKISEDETITSINASFIMRSTVSAKIADNDSVEIPAESIDNDVSEVTKAAKTYKTVKQDELSDLLHVLRALGTTQKVDEVNTDNITVSALVSKKANIQNSAIMRATLYKNVKDNDDVLVPNKAVEGGISVKPTTSGADISLITVSETGSLIDVLSKLFDENDKVNNLDVNGLTIGKISEDETITSINASFIMRSTVSAKIADNDSVEIPAESIDNDVSEVTKAAKTYKTVKQDELSDLLHVLRALGTTQKVDEVNTDNITVSALVSKKANIQNSAIMRATLYKNVKDNEDVLVPTKAVEGGISVKPTTSGTDISLITVAETGYLIDVLDAIFEDDDKVNNLNVDNVLVHTVSSATTQINNSFIMRTTVSAKIADNDSVEIPTSAIDNEIAKVTHDAKDYSTLTKTELEKLLVILDALDTTHTVTVNNVSANNVTVKVLKDHKAYIKASYIMRATLYKNVEDNDDVLVPTPAIEDGTSAKPAGGAIHLITDGETDSLVEVLDALFEDDEKVNNLNVDNITVGTVNAAKAEINSSNIMRVTVASKIEDNDSVVVPVTATDNSLTATKALNTYTALTETELSNLLEILNSFGPAKKINQIDTDDITVGNLKTSKNDIKESQVMRASLYKNIKTNEDVLVSTSALDTGNKLQDLSDIYLVEKQETGKLIDVLDALFEDDDKVNNLNVNGLLVSTVNSSKTQINASIIMRTTISRKVIDNSSVEVPTLAVDNDIEEVTKSAKVYKTITTDELSNLLTILNALDSTGTMTVNNVSANDVTVKVLKDNKSSISNSSIMRATLYNNVEDNEAVLVPEEALIASTSIKVGNPAISLLNVAETGGLIDVLDALFDDNDKVNNLNVDDLTIGEVYTSRTQINASLVMRATVARKVEENTSVDVPVNAVDNTIAPVTKNANTFKVLTTNELDDLLTILNSFGSSSKIASVTANNVTVGTLTSQKATFLDSSIMRATLHRNMKGNADIVISTTVYDEAVSAKDAGLNVNILDDVETGKIIDAFSALFDAGDNVNALEFDNLLVSDLNDNSDKIVDSVVLHGSVSKKLLTNNSIVVVDEDIDDTIDVDLIKDYELEYFLSDMDRLFGNKAVDQLASAINGASTVDDAIAEYSDSNKYQSSIFRATTSRYIINSASFNAFTIERDDLGTEVKTITFNNLGRYGDNKADVITSDEFDNLFKAMKSIKGESTKSITSLFEEGSGDKLSFAQLNASKDDLVESYILRKEFSGQIKNQLTSASLTFLQKLYYGAEKANKLYISKDEMKNILSSVVALNINNVEDMNLDINSDSSFVYSLNEAQIDTICNSTIISYNIRKSIISANSGSYFNDILALRAAHNIPADDVTSVSVLTGTSYVYSTTNNGAEDSDICTLLKSLVSLKTNGYLSIITDNSDTSNVGKFKNENFITTVTDTNILKDSIPGIITNLGSFNTNGAFDLSHLTVPTRGYSNYAQGIIKKDYVRGVSDYTEGELYKLVAAIEACNDLLVHKTLANVQTMLASDIAYDTIDGGLATIDSTFGALLTYRIASVPTFDMPIGDGTTVPDRRDYSSTAGENFINGILMYL